MAFMAFLHLAVFISMNELIIQLAQVLDQLVQTSTLSLKLRL